jgi:hypothetical protein
MSRGITYCIRAVFFVALLLVNALLAEATVFNANSDLLANVTAHTPALNPSGPWSYGYAPMGADWVTGVHWYTSSEYYQDSSMTGWKSTFDVNDPSHVLINYTGGDLGNGVTKDMITMIPSEYGAFSVLRWTAPTVGKVNISAIFNNPLGTATADVWMQKNGVNLLDVERVSINSTTPIAEKDLSNVSVAVGDKIQVLVGYGSNYYGRGDTVGVFEAITYVPEPSSMAILSSAIVGLICYAWRKRRCVPS